jgi:hypothetical protein
MKPLFHKKSNRLESVLRLLVKPVHLGLILLSTLITGVCASLAGFDPAEGLVARSYAVWGDWSAHLSMIQAFRERGVAWIAGSNPLFSEAPFQYPFLSHALTALLSRLTGVDPVSATLLLSLILMFLLPVVLFRFYRSFGISPVASLYSTLVFVLMGGFQALDPNLKSGEPLTNQFGEGSVFTQFILFEFFPQRAFLFALVLALPLLTRLIRAQQGDLKKQSWVLLVLSLLPVIHIHSWLATGTLLLAILVFPVPGSAVLGDRKKILLSGGGVLILSASIAGWLLLRHPAHPLRWDIWFPGWAQNQGSGLETASRMNPVWFWLYNTGLFLPLAGAGAFDHRHHAGLRSILLAGIVLFVVAILFRVQPYYYDNLKIFTWSFLLLAPFAGIALERIHRRFLFIALGLVVLQTSSALWDLRFFAGGAQHAVFFDPLEIRLSREFKRLRKSPEDLVLIQPVHHHWVPCLAGNPVVMGYPGWLWSWGIDYRDTERRIQQILLGGPDADEELKRFRPKWIVLDERKKVGGASANLHYFESRFRRVLEAGPWRVYSSEPL